MNTRRAFLAEAGVALSGLLLPGFTRACCRRRRRCRSGRSPCSCAPPCPGARVPTTTPYAGVCVSGCPIALTGQMDGMYYYRCRCYPMCSNYVDVSSPQLFTNLPRPCDGSSANCIALPATFESYGPASDFHPSTASAAGLKNYITLNEKFIAPQGSGIVARPHGTAQFLDDTVTPKKVKYVRLYVVTRPAGLSTLRVGQELAEGTTDPDPTKHDKRAKRLGGVDHYHQVSSGGQIFHVLTKK